MSKKSNQFLIFLTVVLIGIFYSAYSYAGNTREAVGNTNEELSEISQRQYLITGENLSDSDFYTFMYDETGEYGKRINLFLEYLANSSDEYSFISEMEQPIVVYDTVPSEFFYGYENGRSIPSPDNKLSQLKSIQVSDNFFEEYGITVSEGRTLVAEDYENVSGNTIPVVLGASYGDVFQIGQFIEGEYLFEKFTFEVIGIATKESYMFYNGVYESCDRYFILPALKVSGENEWEKAALLQHTCGILVGKGTRSEAIAFFEQCKKQSGLQLWNFVVKKSEKESSVNAEYLGMSRIILSEFKLISNLMALLCVVAITFTTILEIKKNLKRYAVLYVTGDSYLRLFLKVLGRISIRLGAGDLIALLILIISDEVGTGYLKGQPILVFIAMMSELLCCYYLKKENIVLYLRGKE